ncbi:MAG: ATP-binding protein [Burkholderiales bacterium]
MPIVQFPQALRPKYTESVGKQYFWLLPGALAMVFVVMMALWAEFNDAQSRKVYQQTLIADALSVEAQLTARQDMEKVRLNNVASRLPVGTGDPGAALARLPEVVAGLDRLWNRLVWLDDNNQVIARAERKAPIAPNVSDELRIQSTGQADHYVAAVSDARGGASGKLLARFDITDLLRSTDLVWLNRRYEVNFVSELGEVIATTASIGKRPLGTGYEKPLAGFKDTTLRLTPFDAPESWAQHPKTLALLGGLLLLGLAASALTRHEMRLVTRANAETQTEVAWRQSMEDSALVGLRARDADGRVLYVNKTLCDMVGYSRAELVGLMPPLPFWPSDAVDDMMARNMNTLAGGAPKTGFETRWLHRDGHLIDVMIFESRLVNAKGIHIGWMGSIIDISERKRLEEKDRHHGETLAQHARLNDMGLLASELSHELNQPLTTILSYSAGLNMSLKQLQGVDPEDLVAINEIVRHAGKAGEIVNWIRRQASRSEPVRKYCDLNAVITDVLQLRKKHLQRANAKLVSKLSARVTGVVADRIGIEQVVSNLVRNAADAVNGQPGGGIIGIATEVLEDLTLGSQSIQVTVRDNGPGMQGRTIDVLCTTFYSTKSDGMGLGLGICRTIVESHGGRLVAEEAPGGGAQFRFSLPLAATTAS